MRALLGIWHSEYVLFMRERPLYTGLLSLERLDDQSSGTLVLKADTQGGREASRHRADAEETMEYPWVFRTARPERDGFARCSLMPVTLKRDGRHYLRAELPHDHLFPWPHAKDCREYVKSEELTHDLAIRRAHAAIIGARFPTPPGNITAAMSPKQRKAIFA